MRFVRLRIAGFKSFVDPVEAPIEPGVTGVVGPNGCGKSNFLEALRWVMGATSAKAMRAGGMDDVIFAGNAERPARNHAEVTLTIESGGPEDDASGLFGDNDVIEVSRKITRGGGSTYRINGRETRARDVQILFADASSGANSPALVRQGQINELIAAKPENRRRVLEEAAGVAGLRARRHEAELRLKAAEDNLTRLNDVAGDSERRLEALRRQSREAARYRKLSAEIRALETRAALLRWREAEAAGEAARAAMETAETGVAAAARTEAGAAADATKASEALASTREEEAIADAVAGRLGRERDDVDRKLAALRAEAEHLGGRLRELDADLARERERLEDAGRERARLQTEIGDAGDDDETEVAAAIAEAEAVWRASVQARRASEASLENAAALFAAAQAERDAAARTAEQAKARLARADAELAKLAEEDDAAGASDAERKAAAADTALAHAEAEAERAGQTRQQAENELAACEERLAASRAALADARAAHAATEAEIKGLSALLIPEADGDWSPVSGALTVEPGYERALAAALGADLAAGLSGDAPVRWTRDGVAGGALPDGATPLSAYVEGPPELTERLAQIGVVDDDAGDALAPRLSPGQRLVTIAGRMWRWDGLRARADAPQPEAARFEQRNRLVELEARAAETDALRQTAEREADMAEAARKTAAAARDAAREALKRRDAETKRFAQEAAAAARIRDGLSAKAAARAAARARFDAERVEAQDACAEAQRAAHALTDPAAAEAEVTAKRADAETARGAEAEARAAFEAAKSSLAAQRERRSRLARDLAAWREREAQAATQIQALEAKRGETETASATNQAAPAGLNERLEALREQLEAAEARLRAARDAAATAHRTAKAADVAQRDAERALSAAREARAGAEARAQAAQERIAETAAQIRETFSLEPDALSEDESVAKLDAAAVDKKLKEAQRARDRLGAVNLAAEEDAASLEGEMKSLEAQRADLMAAVAKLRTAITKLNTEGRERLTAAFDIVDGHFQRLFQALFGGGEARLALVDAEDPLEAGLDIHVSPPGKKLGSLSLLSGGEQALTATALIFAVFLSNPAPLCALDEVDAPLDDANVERFCRLLAEMRRLTDTRFVVITHNAVTMSRMDRLYGVTMAERGVSQLVSVDLDQAERLVAAE